MPEEVVFLSFTSIVAVTFLGFGLMRTISKHLERKYGSGSASPELRSEIDHLRVQVEGVDELRERVADLEERADFNERILAQQRSADKLPGGGATDRM